VLNIYETEPAPRSRSLSVAGSAAIHLAVLLIVIQVRAPLQSHLPRYTATQLYLPASAPPLAPAPLQRRPLSVPSVRASELRFVAPPPSALPLKPSAPTPVVDLPAPPELSMARTASTSPRMPSPRPPSPTPPLPPSPVFASASTAIPPSAHPVLRAESFASVPVTAAPVAVAKLQGATGTFGTVPAGTSPRPTQPAATRAAGFGETGVASTNLPGGTSRAASNAVANNGFGGVIASPHSPESPVKQKTETAFTAVVTADPARQPVSVHQSVAQPLEILFKPRPDYTEEARRAHIEGNVVLEVLFTGSGNLRVLRVVSSLGYGLEQKAIDAAGKIRFRPAGADGHPIDTVATIRISFQMAY
jgi:protein TonB